MGIDIGAAISGIADAISEANEYEDKLRYNYALESMKTDMQVDRERKLQAVAEEFGNKAAARDHAYALKEIEARQESGISVALAGKGVNPYARGEGVFYSSVMEADDARRTGKGASISDVKTISQAKGAEQKRLLAENAERISELQAKDKTPWYTPGRGLDDKEQLELANRLEYARKYSSLNTEDNWAYYMNNPKAVPTPYAAPTVPDEQRSKVREQIMNNRNAAQAQAPAAQAQAPVTPQEAGVAAAAPVQAAAPRVSRYGANITPSANGMIQGNGIQGPASLFMDMVNSVNNNRQYTPRTR